jgi:ABC-2 type transport system permease protein
MRFLPIVTQIFLWGAIFESVATAKGLSPDEVRLFGYSYHNMIAYYLLTIISRAFSSMPGLGTGIARQIREGEIKKYLIQPVDMIGFLLLARVAHKLVYYGVAIGPFALVFYLCRDYFPPFPPPEIFAAYVASLIMAFLLGYFLEATLGMLGFWLLEISSLMFVYMLMSFFFSGHMFPIDMLGSPWAEIVQVIPLQYLAYFPAAVYLGKVEGAELIIGLAAQAAWVLFFIAASRLTFNRGVRQYSAFGG